MIDKSPPGLLLTPNITSDRQLKVVMSLVKEKHILSGKTVAVLTETDAEARVKAVVDAALDSIGVKQGSEAVLSITGQDTTAAQSQLDSFIERWKEEKVNVLILAGAAASSKQFIDKVKAEIPDMLLVADTTSVEQGGQDDVKDHRPESLCRHHHRRRPDRPRTLEDRNYRYCKTIFEKQTGIKIPLPNVIVKLPNGVQNNIYGNAEDACCS